MLRVLQPGLFTTIQDLGRKGFQAFGVPVAGAMDDYSFRVANFLVGNLENTPALELTLAGGCYEFLQDGLISLAGADMLAECAGKKLANWQSHSIKAGQKIEFSFAANGCRAYMAVAGGFKADEVMGSFSTYTRAGFGGFKGRTLQKDDVLEINNARPLRELSLPLEFRPTFAETAVIRVLQGPQDREFSPEAFKALTSSEYVIEANSDRMGYRLKGEKIQHLNTADIISDALFKGAIQIPGDGQPIIMLADCQTTGGYTKMCFVITADLPVLAQSRPGDKIKFQLVSNEQAVQALQDYSDKLLAARSLLLTQQTANTNEWKLLVNGIEYQIQVQEER